MNKKEFIKEIKKVYKTNNKIINGYFEYNNIIVGLKIYDKCIQQFTVDGKKSRLSRI